MWRDAWFWHCVWSNPPPRCLWQLWRRVSTLTEPFRPDGNVCCWCLFLPVKLARPKLCKYYAEVTASTGMLFISAGIINPFPKLRSFRKWEKGMDIHPEDETCYSTQYQEAFLEYVENEYCAEHRRVPVNEPESVPSSNLIPSATAPWSAQSSFDASDQSSDDEEYLKSNNVAKMTPRWSDRAARVLTAARLNLDRHPNAPKNCGQIIPNVNHCHSDPMESRSTFWLPDITNWWRYQEETHSKCPDLSNAAHDVFTIMPPGVGVEACFSLGCDVFG